MFYCRFGAMIATSCAAMFSLMALNAYAHAHLSASRSPQWMVMMMVVAMACVVLGYLLTRQRSAAANLGIALIGVMVSATSLSLAREHRAAPDAAADAIRASIASLRNPT